MSEWTEARIEHLRKRWGEGATASTIARELGGVTRNAVVGKAHRLGLSGRANPIKSRDPAATAAKRQRTIAGNSQHGGAAKRVAAVREAALRPTPMAAPITVKPVTRPIPAPSPRLSRDACAWPIGDPKHQDFHFCQAKPIVPGKPYCLEHCQRAYRSPEEAARERAQPAADREAA